MASKVYFTKEISPESLLRMYEVLGRDLAAHGPVAVKMSTGEPGGDYYLHPELIELLVSAVNGTIVECCTAYGGGREHPADHWRCIEDHGFTKIAPVDLMDEDGELEIPVGGGFHLATNFVGAHLERYGAMLVLSHFKGHEDAGMGGALKNVAIGVASKHGKWRIHSAGKYDTREVWKDMPPVDLFLESMADANRAVIQYLGAKNMAYVSVANNLSIDCDCMAHPAEPEMADLGIFASLDPVALDMACYDAVKNADDEGKASLVERMDVLHAPHVCEAAQQLGLGSMEYEIVEV